MPTLDNNLKVQVTSAADTAGISKAESSIKGMEETTKTAGNSFTNFTKAFVFGNIIFSLTSDVALKVKDAFSAVKDEVEEGQQVHSQLNAVLKSTNGIAGMTAESVDVLARSISRSTAINDEAVISAENMLLTFTNIHKEVFPQTTKAVTDMATAMNGGATPSAEQLRNTAILVGKALNDPANGLSRLMRVGVAFTDQQKQQIKTMQEHGNVTGAQTIILNELSKEFGGSATAAAKTWRGELEQVKNTLLDVSANGLQKMSDKATTALPGMIESIKKLYLQVHDFLGPSVSNLWKTFDTQLLPALEKFWHNILEPLVPYIGGAFVLAIRAGVDVLTDLFKIITPVINFMADHKGVVEALAGAFILLKGAMMLGAAFDAIKVGMATLQLVTFPSMIASLGAVTSAWVAAFPVAGILADIALVAKAIQTVIQTHKLLQEINADIASNNKSNAAEIPGLKAAAADPHKSAAQRTSAKNTLHMLGVPGYAHGTNSAQGGVAMVGEQGAEAVVLPRGAEVKTAKQTQRMGGGGGDIFLTQHIYNQVDYNKGIAELGWRLRNKLA